MYRVENQDGLWLVGSKEFDHEVGVYADRGTAEAVAREMNIQAGRRLKEVLFGLKIVGGVYRDFAAFQEAARAWAATGKQEQAYSTR